MIQYLIKTAMARGLMPGKLTYGGADYPCHHSPIVDTPVLSSDGGGFTPQRLVSIVVSSDHASATTFAANRNATLIAADGQSYSLRITSLDAAGNPYFRQLTARHESQGA